MIRTAIVPVAGMGTRLLPATKAVPKELLHVFDMPVLERIVEELVTAGIEKIIFVTHPGRKGAIEAHFTPDPFLEQQLAAKGKQQLLEKVQRTHTMAEYHFAVQEEPLGSGHAVLQALPFLDNNDEAVVVCFGDDLVDTGSAPNAVEQLLRIYEDYGCPSYYVMSVPREDVSAYGVIDPGPGYTEGDAVVPVCGFSEKPTPAAAPSNLISIGKYVVTRPVLDLLESQEQGAGNEINFPEAIERHRQAGNPVMAAVMDGQRFDTGTHLGLLHAVVHYAHQQHPDAVAAIVRPYGEA
ncbi:UTP--glucose-1-phosphate uridylyltransferase [Candidatus Peribacteria bacterium]|nr:UTP--glucose-1-phosphate uridylyltransferase [Candidatus Peribacteria bacterium]